MKLDEESIPKYKPLSKRSKFLKPNAQGQVPAKCINFDWCGKNCVRIINLDTCKKADEAIIEESDCAVLKGEFCEVFK